jgi:hypothetical protein
MELTLYEKLMKGWVYKMKNKRALVFGILFVIGLTFGGCNDSTESSDNGAVGGGGILTINNGPSVNSVEVHNYNSSVTTPEELINGMMAAIIAVGTPGDSPYTLREYSTISPFTGTGTFLVIVNTTAANYFKSEVSFNNGSATIDFNSMTRDADL